MKKAVKNMILAAGAVILALSLSSCGKGGGDREISYDRDYVREKLTGDYSVTYKRTSYGYENAEETTYTTTTKTSGGLYYEFIDVDGQNRSTLFIKVGDGYVMCEGSAGGGFMLRNAPSAHKYTESEAEEHIGFKNSGYMTAYSAHEPMTTPVGDEEIAGRDCDKFEVEIPGQEGVDSFYIDKETGVCLKFTPGAEDKTSGFECADFRRVGVYLPPYTAE